MKVQDLIDLKTKYLEDCENEENKIYFEKIFDQVIEEVNQDIEEVNLKYNFSLLLSGQVDNAFREFEKIKDKRSQALLADLLDTFFDSLKVDGLMYHQRDQVKKYRATGDLSGFSQEVRDRIKQHHENNNFKKIDFYLKRIEKK